MSRGFVKEADYTEPVAERARPAAITARGMASLERALVGAGDPATRAELERRLATSFVPGPPSDPNVAAFGATVGVSETSTGAGERAFTIVGEDEIDVANGRIGATSPLGRALLGARSGDVVVWQRPAGNRSLCICSVRYEP